MKVEVLDDPEVGIVRRFRDHWRGRASLCLLLGDGGGPAGENVRIVGRPERSGGFTVSWLISYEPGRGNARRAYEYLARTYGSPVRAEEVRSEAGVLFHEAMIREGIVSEIDGDALPPISRKP